MKTVTGILVVVAASMGASPADDAEPAATRPAAVRFTSVAVYVDSGDTPLAAYQVEVMAKGGDVKIVGVEGGAHQAFADAPRYDPAALKGGRIIIAAFNTGKDLPTGRTRVATVHVVISGDAKPVYNVTLTTAADADGRRIAPAVSLVPAKEDTP